MAENTPQSSDSNPQQQRAHEPGKQRTPPARPALPVRRRRRWPKIIGAIVVLLIVLIALAPTIVSTRPVRNWVVGMANERLNGTLSVEDWSIGWLGGMKMDGVRVKDAGGRQILEMRSFQTQLTLLKAVTGDYDLGKTSAQGLDCLLVIDREGRTNFQQLAKSAPRTHEPAPTARARGESRLPNVTIEFSADARATVEREGMPPVYVPKGTMTLKIANINQPAEYSLDVDVKAADGRLGKMKLAGSVEAVKQNRLDLDRPSWDVTADVAGVDATMVAALMPAGSSLARLRGVATGRIATKYTSGREGWIEGDFSVVGLETELPATAPAPDSDGAVATTVTFTEQNPLHFVIPHTTFTSPAGLRNWRAARIQMPTGKAIELTCDEGTLTAFVDATPQSLLNVFGSLMNLPREGLQALAGGAKPGANGSIAIKADIDYAMFARKAPAYAHLAKDVTPTSGRIQQTLVIRLTPDSAIVTNDVSTTPILAHNAMWGDVQVKPIKEHVGFTSLGGLNLRDVLVTFESGFASVNISGPSLAQLNGPLSANLREMQQELGKIVSMGHLELAGELTGSVTSKGDFVPDDGYATLTLETTGKNINISGLSGSWSIQQDNVYLHGATTLMRGKSEYVQAIKGTSLVAYTGSAQNPTIHVLAEVPEIKPSLMHGLGDIWGLLQGGKASIKVPNVAPVLAMAGGASSTQPSVATASASGDVAPLPPPKFTAGSVTVAVSFGRENGKTVATIDDATVSNLEFDRGAGHYRQERPINVSGKVTIDAAFDPSKTLVQQINNITIALANAPGAQPGSDLVALSTPEPLVITNPGGEMEMSGNVALAGALRQAWQVYTAWRGQSVPAGRTLDGTYALSQKISTAGGVITLASVNSGIDNLHVAEGGKSFDEKHIVLSNNASFTPKTMDLRLTDFLINMESSSAFRIDAKGSISRLDTAPTFGPLDPASADRGLVATVSYDAEKLDPLLKALTEGDTLRDLKMVGKMENQKMVLAGKYPLDLPFTQAIAQLDSTGGVALSMLAIKGVDMRDINQGVVLSHGIVSVVNQRDPNKPAPDIAFNGGTLRPAGMKLDLTRPSPSLNLPPGPLLANANINPIFADSFLSFLPIFVSPREARGVLSIEVKECRDLPLAWLTPGKEGDTAPPVPGGRAEFIINLKDAVLGGNTVLGTLAQFFKLPTNLPIAIKDARIVIENGRITSDVPLMIERYNLKMAGTVQLYNRKMDMSLIMPRDLFPAQAQRYLPQNITAPFTGNLTSPRLDVAEAVKRSALSNPGDLLQNVLGGIGDRKPPEEQTQGQPEKNRKPDQFNPTDLIPKLLGQPGSDRPTSRPSDGRGSRDR